MSFDSEELRTGHCSICGEHIGREFDHSECSEIKKELYAGSGENKKTTKKFNKKTADNSGRYLSNRYR